MSVVKFEDLSWGLSDADVRRLARATEVPINGFAHPDRAPRHLQLAALNRDTVNMNYYQWHLAKIWAARFPERIKECREFAKQLEADPNLDPAPWVLELGERYNHLVAVQTIVLASHLVPGFGDRLFADPVVQQVRAAWAEAVAAEARRREEAAVSVMASEAEPAVETVASDAGEALGAAAQAAAAHPAGSTPGRAPAATAAAAAATAAIAAAKRGRSPAESEKDKRLAVQVKELQQTLKALRTEKLALQKRLAVLEAKAETARKDAQRLQSERDLFVTIKEWPHPAERTQRLVNALFQALHEQERLRGELAKRSGAAASE